MWEQTQEVGSGMKEPPQWSADCSDHCDSVQGGSICNTSKGCPTLLLCSQAKKWRRVFSLYMTAEADVTWMTETWLWGQPSCSLFRQPQGYCLNVLLASRASAACASTGCMHEGDSPWLLQKVTNRPWSWKKCTRPVFMSTKCTFSVAHGLFDELLVLDFLFALL